MPNLLACIECGKAVSSDLSRCPYCHTPYPRGVICLGCFQTIKQSEAVKYEAHNAQSVKYFHLTCYEQVKHPPSQVPGISQQVLECETSQKLTKHNLEELLQADWERNRQEEARKRADRRYKTISRTLKFLFLAGVGFVFWGVILDLIFGDFGLIIAFIVTILLTVEIMKEM